MQQKETPKCSVQGFGLHCHTYTIAYAGVGRRKSGKASCFAWTAMPFHGEATAILTFSPQRCTKNITGSKLPNLLASQRRHKFEVKAS